LATVSLQKKETDMTFANDYFLSKTFWTAVGAIIAALVAAYHHQISWPAAIAAIFSAIQTVNLRDAVVKSGIAQN
jgi:hypothetical protein